MCVHIYTCTHAYVHVHMQYMSGFSLTAVHEMDEGTTYVRVHAHSFMDQCGCYTNMDIYAI